MLKITRLADYSILIICCFNKNSRVKLTAPEISKLTGLSLHTVNKILAKLVKGKILNTSRGVSGGYVASKELDDISINDIIEIVEGPVAITDCISDHSKKCNLIDICGTKKALSYVNNAIIKTLQDIKIKDIDLKTSHLNRL